MLSIVELTKEYRINSRTGNGNKIKAVDNVSLHFERGKCYALVGESGSGKSTLAKILIGLETPTQGKILYCGADVAYLSGNERLRMRRNIKMVFQNSKSALNPRWLVCDSIAEPLVNRHELDKAGRMRRIKEYLELVHLPQTTWCKHPHELSGGEQTRVCIARALITEPEFLIMDESVSGLDATIKKQILDLMLSIRSEIQCSYLFITHDIEAAFYIADNIAVMKAGQIIESVADIRSLGELREDYSKLLVSSLPDIRNILLGTQSDDKTAVYAEPPLPL